MSLYNALFGRNPMAPLLLEALGKEPSYFGRFRDAFVTHYKGQLAIAVFTRNGGGNREHEMPYFDEDDGYLGDADDDFDSTYATIWFRVPTGWAPLLEPLADTATPPGERMQALIAKLQQRGNERDPEVKRALEVGAAALAPIIEAATDGEAPGTGSGTVASGSDPR